jgi:hypothetical protein
MLFGRVPHQVVLDPVARNPKLVPLKRTEQASSLPHECNYVCDDGSAERYVPKPNLVTVAIRAAKSPPRLTPLWSTSNTTQIREWSL